MCSETTYTGEPANETTVVPTPPNPAYESDVLVVVREARRMFSALGPRALSAACARGRCMRDVSNR